MENTINGEDSLLTLIDLHTRRKTVKDNSENSFKSHKTDAKEEEITESVADVKTESTPKQHENKENLSEWRWKKKETNDQWENIQEMTESDFLTSTADIYLNRRVELEDAVISEETKECFAQLCSEYDDIFSKNNQDIGKTPLIEMEIDTGDSLPVPQSPYMLSLKHYEWVWKEIEMLEKAGVIVKSLFPWASLVIVVPKKPPRRRLVIDYRKSICYNSKLKEQTSQQDVFHCTHYQR